MDWWSITIRPLDRRYSLGICSVSLVLWAGLVFGRGDEPSAVTSVSDLRGLPGRAFNIGRPLTLNGIVTLTDPARNLFILQDGTGAIALYPDPPGITVQPGQRVLLKASTCAPYSFDCPQYPFHPMGQDVRATFEAPDNESDFRLTRMRGWLRPPVTGNYTFWISSDDSSDLWLSDSEDGGQAVELHLFQRVDGRISMSGLAFRPSDQKAFFCGQVIPTISRRFKSSN